MCARDTLRSTTADDFSNISYYFMIRLVTTGWAPVAAARIKGQLLENMVISSNIDCWNTEAGDSLLFYCLVRTYRGR